MKYSTVRQNDSSAYCYPHLGERKRRRFATPRDCVLAVTAIRYLIIEHGGAE